MPTEDRIPLQYIILTAACLFLSLLSGCDRIQTWKDARKAAHQGVAKSDVELAYQTATAELNLANAESPYLVLDLAGRVIQIRLKGAILLTVPMVMMEGGEADLEAFAQSFINGRGKLVRPVAGSYLFEAQDQTPDSILKIVSNVVNVSPELLQREIPSRFRIFWNDKLLLDIVTEQAETKPLPTKVEGTLQERLQGQLQNTMMEARYVLRRPFGARLLVLRVQPDDALTIHRMAKAGTPTLLQLVSTDPVVPVKGKRGDKARGKGREE